MKWLAMVAVVAEGVTEEVAEAVVVVVVVAVEVTAVLIQHPWAAVVDGRHLKSCLTSTFQHQTFAMAPRSSVFTSRCSGRGGDFTVYFPIGAGIAGILDLWASSFVQVPMLCGLNSHCSHSCEPQKTCGRTSS